MAQYNDLDCILLIDDDAPTNFYHEIVIESTGIDTQIKSLTSGQDAIEYLTETGKYAGEHLPQPGIIFLDVNMPSMNGWEFLEEYSHLSKKEKAHKIVIMLTTSLNPVDKAKADANEYITTFLNKPLTPEKIIELVNEHYTIKV